MTFSQPVGKLSDCGWFASVGEERRATHRVVKLVVFEAQHDAVLCVGSYPAVFISWTAGVQIFLCSLNDCFY